MVVFTDTDGQVVAVYTHDTQSHAWDSYTRREITDPAEIATLKRLGRDAQFTTRGIVERPNPVQPQPTPDTPDQARFKELKGKLLADAISDSELRELLKLQYTPGVAAVPATRVP